MIRPVIQIAARRFRGVNACPMRTVREYVKVAVHDPTRVAELDRTNLGVGDCDAGW